MGAKTIIAWTDHTFNVAWGCVKVSAGCAHCYAERFARQRAGLDVWGLGKPRRTFGAKHWAEPVAWNRAAEAEGRRHRVFASSMCDVFEDHPTLAAERAKLWPLIRATPWLDWQILTKRPENILSALPADWGQGYPNAWLGVTVEHMATAHRAATLAAVPAVVRFVSYEPALGPLEAMDLAGIDWLIYGGESGPGYRPHDIAWPRAMRAKCEAAGVPYFFKQSSAIRTDMGVTLDGEIVRAYPTPRQPAVPALSA